MAASMWRMNGLWRGMALALVLFTLLLNNAADATDAPTAYPNPTDSAADPGALGTSDPQTAAPDAGGPADDTATIVPFSGESNGTAAPGDGPFDLSVLTDSTAVPNADSQGGAETSGTSGTTAAPIILTVIEVTNAPAAAPVAPETRAPLRLVVPDVKCVEKEAIDENNAVKAVVKTNDCEHTKMIIQSNPAAWCPLDNCRLNLFQEDTTVLVASPDAKMSTLAGALQSENIKEPLGVSAVETPPSSSGSSVFVTVLLLGLLLAAALIGGYWLKTRRGSDAKGIRLAEEAYPVDEQNQGNTLVSVAPLNPPAETQEKPSVNGESPEAEKTQPPPTNGHSTTKTADTEL